jgi:cullin-associated NEDD8-dissociated protein 1
LILHPCPFLFLTISPTSFPSGVPADLPPAIKPQLAPYITINDIPLLVCTLNVLTALLQLSPSITFPVIESDCLPAAYDLGANRLIAGPSLEALLSFFAALVKADLQIEMHVVPGLTIALEKANATGGGSPGNVSKCIGVVVKAQPSGAAGVIAQFAKLLKVRMFLSISSPVRSF